VSLEQFTAAGVDERLRMLGSGALASKLPFLQRFGAVMRFGRPRTAVAGVIAFALGASYVGPAAAWRVGVLAVAMFLCAFLANMLNTCTDIGEDVRNLPGRVYLLGRFGKRALEQTCTAFALVLLALGGLLGMETLLGMVVCLAVIHQYSFPPLAAKRRPVLGLVAFAQAVTLPFFMGALVDGNGAYARRLLAALAGGVADAAALHDAHRFLAMGAFMFTWFVAKGMFKNVPDYEGDKQAGVRTSATVLPSRRAAAIAAALATVAAYLAIGALLWLGLAADRFWIALVWLLPAAYNALRLVGAPSGDAANRCLKVDMFISTGFVSTLLALAAPSWQSLGLVALAATIIGVSDRLEIDTRRDADCAPTPTPTATAR
jgi:4-hydroxybenzoate polyprenyltransferase